MLRTRRVLTGAIIGLTLAASTLATGSLNPASATNVATFDRQGHEFSNGGLFVRGTTCRVDWRRGRFATNEPAPTESMVIDDHASNGGAATCDLIGLRWTSDVAFPGAAAYHLASPTGTVSDSHAPSGSLFVFSDIRPGTTVTILACGRDGTGAKRWQKIDVKGDGQAWFRATDAASVTLGAAGTGCPITAINSGVFTSAAVVSGTFPSAFASDPRGYGVTQAEAATTTLTGTATKVTYGSNFHGTGWAQGFSVGNRITFPQSAGQTCANQTFGFRMTLPFQSVADTTLGQSVTLGVGSAVVENHDLKATYKPGGDWTNWATPVYFYGQCNAFGAGSGPIPSVWLQRNAGGSGFNVDEVLNITG